MQYWWEGKLIYQLWKIKWRFLKKLKIELPHDPAVPIPGIHPQEMKRGHQRDIYRFTAALLTVSKICKQPKCPTVNE